ncbi:hypothetical protein DsansV1_C20g0163961 [Dioscorea sansibarensis]
MRCAWRPGNPALCLRSPVSRTCWLEEFCLKIKKYKANTKIEW